MTASVVLRHYQRRGPIFLECGDRLWIDPLHLLAGKLTPRRLPLIRVYAPPVAAPIEIDALAAACLGSIAFGCPGVIPEWLQNLDGVETALHVLLKHGLIEAPDETALPANVALEPAPFDDWHGPAVLYHYASRWSGIIARDQVPTDPASAARAFDASHAAFEQQARARGLPPSHQPDRGDTRTVIALPRTPATALDELLRARETHRLYRTDRPLALAQAARVLHRAFGTIGVVALGGGLHALRKHAPSGGGMHPVEAYPLVVDVDGLASGWYHYRACEHRLAPVKAVARDAARREVERLTAGQSYFATAPMVVVLTLRFPRHHWKYPQHARAYRVMLLEAGHLGQTFYLAATEAGLGAFFTAAVNDADIDVELGLDGVEEGAIAIVGCGEPSTEGRALRLSSYVEGG